MRDGSCLMAGACAFAFEISAITGGCISAAGGGIAAFGTSTAFGGSATGFTGEEVGGSIVGTLSRDFASIGGKGSRRCKRIQDLITSVRSLAKKRNLRSSSFSPAHVKKIFLAFSPQIGTKRQGLHILPLCRLCFFRFDWRNDRPFRRKYVS